MPFTPFHLGPALLFGLALSAVFDLPTLLVASVIPDVEPFCVMYFHVQDYPPHGFFHSYLGASILAIAIALIIYPLRDWVDRIMSIFRVSQKFSFRKILFTSFVGVYSHVFLDSFLYGEMAPFYPLEVNPFYTLFVAYPVYTIIYGFCTVTGLFGIVLYAYLIGKRKSLELAE